jgi:TetR/AcrR family transcriptional regulator, regulator of cefoperazone and chloramphenicol sensitivity
MDTPEPARTPLTRPAAEPRPAAAAATEDGRIARGLGTRARLLEEALRLFAEKGYAQTSTREICLAAGVNAASIHYYFGDKGGLYRAVYLEPIQQLMVAAREIADAGDPFDTTMRRTYDAFLAPLKHSDLQTMQILKLHFREQADPTGLTGDDVMGLVQSHFDAIVAMLGRELGVAAPDDDLRRLASSLIGLAVDFVTSADWLRRIAPGLLSGPEAVDRMSRRLSGYAVAMLASERERRTRDATGEGE